MQRIKSLQHGEGHTGGLVHARIYIATGLDYFFYIKNNI